MPTKIDTIKPANKVVAERIRAGMTAFGYGVRGGNKAFAALYIGDEKRSPMVSDWRKGRYLPEPEKLERMATDWGTTLTGSGSGKDRRRLGILGRRSRRHYSVANDVQTMT